MKDDNLKTKVVVHLITNSRYNRTKYHQINTVDDEEKNKRYTRECWLWWMSSIVYKFILHY